MQTRCFIGNGPYGGLLADPIVGRRYDEFAFGILVFAKYQDECMQNHSAPNANSKIDATNGNAQDVPNPESNQSRTR